MADSHRKLDAKGVALVGEDVQRLYAVPALEKAITVLNALAEAESMNITEIHSRLQIPKSSTFIIMNTLERHNFMR